MNNYINFVKVIFLLINLKLLKLVFCFDVNFRAIYDVDIQPFNTQIYKREMTQFFDKASYSFNGFQKIESIPVLFPIDICILNLDGIKYAASLHKKPDGSRHFVVHKMNNGTYQLLSDFSTPNAIAMDCKGLGTEGFIALAYNISTPVQTAREGSPIYILTGDHLRAIQYFATPNLVKVYLRVQGHDVMLLQTFKNTKSTPHLHCPYFKWSGSTFNRVGQIPCSNARHLEPFSIDYEQYVAVANYADQRGRTSTNSEIYKFDHEKKQFRLFQKIKTNGAVDVRYFSVPVDVARRQHFLIFGNSVTARSNSLNDEIEKSKNLEADSIFYLFDKGQFVPYQRLTLYAVKQFLPIQNIDAEKFLLLVASSNQDIKIYNLNDWKFEESTTQFTAGALGKGVARMRIFQEQDMSYLVIANENMMDNETNVFLPIFKQEEHANALRQQIIDWAKENMERLKKIDVEQLKRNVEQKLQNQYSTLNLPNININNAHIENVITESLTSHRLHMDSNYWQALSYAQRALDVLEKSQKLRQMRKREASLMPTNDYDLETMKVDTLVVRQKLMAENVNGIQSKSPKFKHIKAKEVIVTGKYLEPLVKSADKTDLTNDNDLAATFNVNNLNIIGKINGLKWNDLFNNTLKCEGTQFIKSSAKFENLLTTTVAVSNETINNKNLLKLVPINGGSFVVDQHVLFNDHVTAKNVVINERLNQIHIMQQNFDALLKKSNKTQIIRGPKRLNNVRLLQPIIVRGSMSSNHLRAISPSKAIHKDLVLHGDYEIDGDVVITKTLATQDLLDSKSNASLKTNLSNGIRVDIPLENVNLKLNTQIIANNTIVSFINTKDMQELIKTNKNTSQIVEGLKIFKHDLFIENGLSEVKLINGVDTEKLADELLLKNTNQRIAVPMHFGRLIAKGLQAPKLTMHNKPINEFLQKTGKQHVVGNLKVEKLIVDHFVPKNVNTNGKIFDKSPNEFYQHRASTTPNNLHNVTKIEGTIYVKNLNINGSLNGIPVINLERKLQQLEGDIKYVGNYNFNYEMSIQNLTFLEQLNGINAFDFGKCWLQKTGIQTFAAPQTFASTRFKKGATLMGRINGFFLRDFDEQTFLIDRDEYIKDAIFQNPIGLQKSLNTNELNNLQVPNDILFRDSKVPQIVNGNILIEKDLRVEGSISNATSINDINMNNIRRFLNSVTEKSTLHVKSAHFSYAPKYKTLNKNSLQEMLDTIWLGNENVELPHHVEIREGNFEGLLDLEGPINNMNLEYLQRNYLSISKPQTVPTAAIFLKNAAFSSLNADEINLLGPLTEAASNSSIYFDDFVANTLKKSGFHEIRNNWTLLEAVIFGSLKDVTINELNLAQDVVRFDKQNFIRAEKRIPATATIEKLYITPESLVNGVSVANWLKNAAYTNRNQTIYGITTLDNANIADLHVNGLVNKKQFNKNTLWLRNENQHVSGKVSILNKLKTEERVLVNNIKDLEAVSINNKNVYDFLGGIAKSAPSQMIESHLAFEQPLVIAGYRNSDEKLVDSKWKRQTFDVANNWNDLQRATQMLQNILRERDVVLKEIKLKQNVAINASKLIYFPIFMEGELINLIGFSNNFIEETKNLVFYRWSETCECFIPYSEELPWLPRDSKTLEALKLLFGTTEYIAIKKPELGLVFANKTISEDVLKEILNFQNGKKLTPFKLRQEDCLMVFRGVSAVKIQIYCLDLNEKSLFYKPGDDLLLEGDAKQMVMLSNQFIALLFDDAVEIWSTHAGFNFQERLVLKNDASEIAACRAKNAIFLAITTVKKSKTLLETAVEIYSFLEERNLQHQQTITFDVIVEQIDFQFLNESQDLLLVVRTKMYNKSLLIYQLQGVKGFQQIFAGGAFNVPNKMQFLHLKYMKKYFIVLFTPNSTDIVEIVFNTV